jgi:hypothetical protein
MTDTLGWRATFGVVTPSPNRVVQPEYDGMRPVGVTNHLARMAFSVPPVSNDAEFQDASEILREVKRQNKTLEERKQSVTKPLNGVLNEIRSWFRPPQDTLTKCEVHIKNLLAAYQLESQRKNREALAAIAAAAKVQDAQAVEIAVNQIVEAPQAKGVSIRQFWSWELVDAAVVPREFLGVDPAKLDAYAKAAAGAEPKAVPGIRFVQKSSVTARS